MREQNDSLLRPQKRLALRHLISIAVSCTLMLGIILSLAVNTSRLNRFLEENTKDYNRGRLQPAGQ